MLIVKMICLAIGTVLAVLFILLTMRGKKEDWRIEGVPEKEFSDKELWAAGFAMQQMPMFSMDSAVGKKMISASAILHRDFPKSRADSRKNHPQTNAHFCGR